MGNLINKEIDIERSRDIFREQNDPPTLEEFRIIMKDCLKCPVYIATEIGSFLYSLYTKLPGEVWREVFNTPEFDELGKYCFPLPWNRND